MLCTYQAVNLSDLWKISLYVLLVVLEPDYAIFLLDIFKEMASLGLCMWWCSFCISITIISHSLNFLVALLLLNFVRFIWLSVKQILFWIIFSFLFKKTWIFLVPGISDRLHDPEPTWKFWHRLLMTEFGLGSVTVFPFPTPSGRTSEIVDFRPKGVGFHP